jgi:hypothetical protein
MDHQELYNIKKNKANLVCNILLSEDRTTSSLENQKVASWWVIGSLLWLPHFGPGISAVLRCKNTLWWWNIWCLKSKTRVENKYSMCMPPLSDDGKVVSWRFSMTLVACSISCQKRKKEHHRLMTHLVFLNSEFCSY